MTKTEKRPTKVTRKSVRAMKKSAKASGFGRGDHLVAPGGRHAIQLNQCKSCQNAEVGDEGCERERRVLQDALRKDDPHGRVVELACDPYRPGRCRFEIIPGGST